MGVVRTVRATTDDLVATKGRLAIVGSVNSFVSVASTGVYAMSKHAVKFGCSVVRTAPQGGLSHPLGTWFRGFRNQRYRSRRAFFGQRSSTQPTLLDGAVYRSSGTDHGESHRTSPARTNLDHLGHFIVGVERHA